MKLALSAVLCALTFFTHLPAVCAAGGEKWALVVGVSKFKDPAITCPYGAKNARDFAAFLVKEGGFKTDHVKVLIDAAATKSEIMLAMGENFLPMMAGPKDMAVVYISTAATPSSGDFGGLNYLCAYDANKNSLFASGIGIQNLGDIIKPRIAADRLVTIIDSSYSGAEGRSLFGNRAATGCSPIAITIAAAQGDQISQAAKVGGNSVFTKFLLSGLRKDKNIKAAFDYTAAEVTREVSTDYHVKQEPSLKVSPGGDDVSL
ncbi:MAG: caspase family protein [Cyanobacteria bacterium SZAS LIN-2]|nr:caspase family protein [Cyanobacteria bacterium SZAS LIN-2]